MRSNEEIVSTFEGAFAPLQCGVETWDYEEKIRLRVFDPKGQPLVSFPKLVLDQMRSDSALCSIIAEARLRIEAKGIALDPWQLRAQ